MPTGDKSEVPDYVIAQRRASGANEQVSIHYDNDPPELTSKLQDSDDEDANISRNNTGKLRNDTNNDVGDKEFTLEDVYVKTVSIDNVEVGGTEGETLSEKPKDESLLRKFSHAINLETAVADTEDLPLIW